MNEKDNKLNKGSFLCIGDYDKAEWGVPEGYPYKKTDYAVGYEYLRSETIRQYDFLYNSVSYVAGLISNEEHGLFALFLPSAESFPVGMKC